MKPTDRGTTFQFSENQTAALWAAWIEGLFEVVALKSQFSDPKWNCLVDFLILEQTLTTGQLYILTVLSIVKFPHKSL